MNNVSPILLSNCNQCGKEFLKFSLKLEWGYACEAYESSSCASCCSNDEGLYDHSVFMESGVEFKSIEDYVKYLNGDISLCISCGMSDNVLFDGKTSGFCKISFACSIPCLRKATFPEYYTKKPDKEPLGDYKCRYCSKEFLRYNEYHVVCSTDCYGKFYQ